MRNCELCKYPARMYCESDQASLCWDCDEKVHGANFLVARHSRCLLCHVCQSKTTWTASGLKLGHTVSVCNSCATIGNSRENEICAEEEEVHARNREGDEDEDDEDEDDEEGGVDEDEDYSGCEDDEDGENQVVPWSSTPPPPVASSSSSGESTGRLNSESGGAVSTLKRSRDQDSNLDANEDIIDCYSSQHNYSTISTTLTLRAPGEIDDTSFTSSRPLKQTRTQVGHSTTFEDHKAIISSLKRFQQSTIYGNKISASILHIQKLSRDPKVIDLNQN